jgi:SAM-dependent methyltransferase
VAPPAAPEPGGVMRRTYQLLYRLGVRPWDSDDIPPPLRTLAAELPPGIAVDLGCGTGAQACDLAERGWAVTAVDFVAAAVATARRRPGASRVRWRVADVTDPAAVDPSGELAGVATLVLDNGCAHGIPDGSRAGWMSTVEHVAGPGAHLLVRAAPRVRPRTDPGTGPGPGPRGGRRIGPQGMDRTELARLLGSGWRELAAPAPGWHLYRRIATPVPWGDVDADR